MTNSRGSQKPMSRAWIAVAAFSTVVEWYDFTLYLYLATVLSRVFFGPRGTALNATLAAFAIAYLLRPLGAIFGGLTPYVAQVLTERTGSTMAPGAMIAVVAVLVLPILATLPETAPTK
jgi:MFS transporter, MHS family, proline/betaine transporter